MTPHVTRVAMYQNLLNCKICRSLGIDLVYLLVLGAFQQKLYLQKIQDTDLLKCIL